VGEWREEEGDEGVCNFVEVKMIKNTCERLMKKL
jgi:hypothetical protein